jgi:hypothetical protein
MRKYNFAETEKENKESDNYRQIDDNRPLLVLDDPDNPDEKGGYAGHRRDKDRHRQKKVTEKRFPTSLARRHKHKEYGDK